VVEASPRADVERINERLKETDSPFRVAIVNVDDLLLLEKNARYMTNAQFRNLVNNIKRDGGLSSVPFCVREGDKFRVLSGNHRVMAAREAGLREILIMYTERQLSRQEQVAIQLSHNAIVGQDDPLILKELWEEIEDLDLKYYSGLDDKLLGTLEPVSLASIAEAAMEWRSLSFLFLPEEVDRLKEVLDQALKQLPTETEAIVARLADFDRMLDAMTKTQAAHKVTNAAVTIMLMLDLFERNLLALREGWLDLETGEAKHDGWVPVASVLGTENIPAGAAAVINRAIEKMLQDGEVSPKNRWQALEYLAAQYLGGE